MRSSDLCRICARAGRVWSVFVFSKTLSRIVKEEQTMVSFFRSLARCSVFLLVNLPQKHWSLLVRLVFLFEYVVELTLYVSCLIICYYYCFVFQVSLSCLNVANEYMHKSYLYAHFRYYSKKVFVDLSL